jgi:hypothetical protein
MRPRGHVGVHKSVLRNRLSDDDTDAAEVLDPSIGGSSVALSLQLLEPTDAWVLSTWKGNNVNDPREPGGVLRA